MEVRRNITHLKTNTISSNTNNPEHQSVITLPLTKNITSLLKDAVMITNTFSSFKDTLNSL